LHITAAHFDRPCPLRWSTLLPSVQSQCVIDEDTNSIYDTKILKAAIGIRSNNDKPGVDYDSASVKRIVVHRKQMLSALLGVRCCDF